LEWYAWLITAICAAAVFAIVFRWLYRTGKGPNTQRARELFAAQREHLEMDFLNAAGASGKPRGLLWKSLEWDEPVVFARDRTTGQLAALVGVTIQFEAVPGSDMEGLPAVGNLRSASAVFFYDQGRWHTLGKAVFNLNPAEAVAHFRKQYDPL
jgi:hypothetical protein